MSPEKFAALLKLYVEDKLSVHNKLLVSNWYNAIKEVDAAKLTEEEATEMQDKLWKKLKGQM